MNYEEELNQAYMLMAFSSLVKNDDRTNFLTKQRQRGEPGGEREEVKNARMHLKKYVYWIPAYSYSISTLKVNFLSSSMGYIRNNSTAELNYLLLLS